MIDLTKYSKFTIFFGIIFILNLLFFTYLVEYRVVAKPIIMASLIGFYISVERRQSNAFVLAMIFALLGDVFLLFTSEAFFLIGLGCFLIMQLLYAFIFSSEASHDKKKLHSGALILKMRCITLRKRRGRTDIPIFVDQGLRHPLSRSDPAASRKALRMRRQKFVEFGAAHGRQSSVANVQDMDDVALNSEDDPVAPATLAVD